MEKEPYIGSVERHNSHLFVNLSQNGVFDRCVHMDLSIHNRNARLGDPVLSRVVSLSQVHNIVDGCAEGAKERLLSEYTHCIQTLNGVFQQLWVSYHLLCFPRLISCCCGFLTEIIVLSKSQAFFMNEETRRIANIYLFFVEKWE